MLLTGVILALVGLAFWLYCLIDLLLTPSESCRYLPKLTWVVVVAVVLGFGAVAWLLVGRPPTSRAAWRNALRGTTRPHRAGWPPAVGRRWIPWVRGPGLRGRRAARWSGGYALPDFSRITDAKSRHPAGRARPQGPDDDPAFLRHLEDLIRGNQDIGND